MTLASFDWCNGLVIPFRDSFPRLLPWPRLRPLRAYVLFPIHEILKSELTLGLVVTTHLVVEGRGHQGPKL